MKAIVCASSSNARLQIEVSNVVVSKLSLKDLLVAVSDLLKRFIDHDFASVVLYNEERQELRVHALDKAPPAGPLGEGTILPMEGTPPGLAIKTRKSVRRDHLDLKEFHAPMLQQAYAAGLRCGCSVPLISHGRILGTINVGCMREAAVSEQDQELLEQRPQEFLCWHCPQPEVPQRQLTALCLLTLNS